MIDYAVKWNELDDLLKTLDESPSSGGGWHIQVTEVTPEFLVGTYETATDEPHDTLQRVLRNNPVLVELSFGDSAKETFANVVDANNMFSRCEWLVSVGLPDMPNAEEVWEMFDRCSRLQSVTLPTSFPKAIYSRHFFARCSSLKEAVMPSMPLVTSISAFFYGCNALESVQLPSAFPLAEDAVSLFEGCRSLTSIRLPELPLMTDVALMFANCVNLKRVDLCSLKSIKDRIYGNSHSDSGMCGMFFGCGELEEIHGWDIPSNVNAEQDSVFHPRTPLFGGCDKLRAIYVSSSSSSSDAESWRSFAVSHGSGGDDTVTVYGSDGSTEATATVPNTEGRSVEATDWVDELILSDAEIPGVKVADMMATRLPVTGDMNAADPSEDTFTLWVKNGDRKRVNMKLSDFTNDMKLSDFTNDMSLSDFTNDLLIPVGRPANVQVGSIWLG